MSENFLMEFDLVGAEWVVVAYLANDANMIGVVKSGKSPHIVTGSLISGATEEFVAAEAKLVGMNSDPDTILSLRAPLEIPQGIFLPRSMSIRQAGKKSNHGLNYGMKYKLFALNNEIPEGEAAMMVEAYSTVAYPGIQNYWKGCREELRANDRTLENCFGCKARLLGEWGPDLWNQAYSYKPQSTVGYSCLEGMCLAFEDLSDPFFPIDLGAQVHDSVMFQYPFDRPSEYLGHVVNKMGGEYLRPDLTYGEHTFKLDTELKVGWNWGEMKTVETKELTAQAIGDAIKATLTKSRDASASAPANPQDHSVASQ